MSPSAKKIIPAAEKKEKRFSVASSAAFSHAKAAERRRNSQSCKKIKKIFKKG